MSIESVIAMAERDGMVWCLRTANRGTPGYKAVCGLPDSNQSAEATHLTPEGALLAAYRQVRPLPGAEVPLGSRLHG